MEQNENQEVELDMNHLMKVRKEKLDNLIAEGKNPFEITKFNRTHTSEDIEKHYDELEVKAGWIGRLCRGKARKSPKRKSKHEKTENSKNFKKV